MFRDFSKCVILTPIPTYVPTTYISTYARINAFCHITVVAAYNSNTAMTTTHHIIIMNTRNEK